MSCWQCLKTSLKGARKGCFRGYVLPGAKTFLEKTTMYCTNKKMSDFSISPSTDCVLQRCDSCFPIIIPHPVEPCVLLLRAAESWRTDLQRLELGVIFSFRASFLYICVLTENRGEDFIPTSTSPELLAFIFLALQHSIHIHTKCALFWHTCTDA